MLGYEFNHNLISKYTVVLAKLFTDITVLRRDAAGNIAQRVHVPIQEGPSARWAAINDQYPNPATDKTIAVVTPRMALELMDIRYDGQNKLTKLTRRVKPAPGMKGNFLTQFAPNPYVFTYNLNILVKYAEDGYNIVEQILAFFTPEFTVSANIIPEMGIKKNIPITLVGVAAEDVYEGSPQDRRIISWTLTFELKGEIYGPINKSAIIKRAQIDFHAMSEEVEVENTPRHSRYVVYPGLTPSGEPTTNANATVHYSEIDVDDDWDFIEEFYAYDDGKKYDPETGQDVPVLVIDDDTLPPT